ncbi:MAG: C-terminal binding protein [SAR202 cluster bacterium]|nr:C-terminal binding protein [SAR202 cluster bacterium]
MTRKVLVTDYVWPSTDPERAVIEAGGAELVIAPDSDEDTLIELARDSDAIMTCFAKVTEKVVRAAENCLIVSRYGVGTDNIAVDVATELGIIVTYVPDYCVDEVSDHVLGMMLAWNRRIVMHNTDTKMNGWGNAGLGFRIMRLRGKRLGVVGFGRIGRAVADKARAFGMEVIASDPFVTAEQMAEVGVVKAETPELLSQCEFVTLHSPLIPETQDMISVEEFGQMRSDAFLINCARGGLVDEEALYSALTSGAIAGAGLDVLVDLQPPLDHRIIQLDNVIVTPHTAFFSQEATLELEERAAEAVIDVFKGRTPANVFNKSVLESSRQDVS